MAMSLTTKPVNIPNGEYEAIWSGYNMEIVVGGKKVKVETSMGIRSINVHVKIQVTDGFVTKAPDETT